MTGINAPVPRVAPPSPLWTGKEGRLEGQSWHGAVTGLSGDLEAVCHWSPGMPGVSFLSPPCLWATSACLPCPCFQPETLGRGQPSCPCYTFVLCCVGPRDGAGLGCGHPGSTDLNSQEASSWALVCLQLLWSWEDGSRQQWERWGTAMCQPGCQCSSAAEWV